MRASGAASSMCPDLIHDRQSYYFRTDPLFETAAAMVRFMTFSKLSLSASIRNDTRFKILLKVRPFNPGSVLLPFTRGPRRRTSSGLVGNLEVVCASRGLFAVSNFWSRRGRGLILKFLFVFLLLAVGFTPNVAWALVTCTYAASVN